MSKGSIHVHGQDCHSKNVKGKHQIYLTWHIFCCACMLQYTQRQKKLITCLEGHKFTKIHGIKININLDPYQEAVVLLIKHI